VLLLLLVVIFGFAQPVRAGSNAAANGNGLLLSHVIIIMFENRPINGTYGIINQPGGPYPVYAPYITSLADNYSLAADYYDLSNGGCGSITDYIAITSADISAINSACSAGGHCNDYYNITTYCSLSQQNIADRIEAAGLSWKAYMENMTVPCELNTSADYRYQVGHNPWVYYSNIRANATRCDSHVIPAWADGNTDGALLNDLNGASTPNLMWLTPNICNSMYVYCPNGVDSGTSCTHTDPDIQSTCVGEGDLFLQTLVPEIMNTQAWNSGSTALFLTWDEATFDSRSQCPAYNSSVPYPSDHCQIPGIWLGPRVKQHYVSTAFYTHYSVLATLEAIWGLPALTSHDASASLMTEFFKTEFTITTSSSVLTAPIGTNSTSILTLTSLIGYSGNISLGVTVQAPIMIGGNGGGGHPPLRMAPLSVLPTASITPVSLFLNSGQSSQCTLTIILPLGVLAGNYPVVVTATDGILSHSILLTIVATDFSLTTPATSLIIPAGSNATQTLSLQSLNGFQGNVTLTATIAPSGPTATLSPPTVYLTFNSGITMTINVPSITTSGNYTITVQAISGTLSHTLFINLLVPSNGSTTFLGKIVMSNTMPIVVLAFTTLLASFSIYATKTRYLKNRKTSFRTRPFRGITQTPRHSYPRLNPIFLGPLWTIVPDNSD